ncbi:MAG: DegT/DnrJ/EryC1/StrS family aminotransferase [Pseudomonadota bacterium]
MLFPYLKPVIPPPEAWVPHLEASYKAKFFSNFGPLAVRLAEQMSETYLHPSYEGVLCSSNTAGLLAALNAIDVYGKKVILPDFTFAATPQAIFAAGATPVVCDIDPMIWELCPKSLAAALDQHPDVAAVIHVRPFGFVRDISATREICASRDLPLIVDAAAGLGKTDTDHRFGSDHGEIEVFSLHATKVFAIGEGGFVGAPPDMIAKIRRAMNFGFNRDRTYEDGLNGKIDEFRAAIGLSTIEMINGWIDVRRQHAEFYDAYFEALPQHKLIQSPGNSPWAQYPVLFDKDIDNAAIGVFADLGIEIKKYYWPGVNNAYRGRRPIEAMPLPVSESLQNRFACLPIYSDFKPELGSIMRPRLASAIEAISEM